VKKLLALIVLVSLALSGCATGKFLGFLATTDYVDAKSKAVADQQAAQIEQLKSQVAENATALEAAKSAVEKMNKVQKTISDLQESMKDVQDKVGSMPKDVIKQIADLLQASLN